MPVSPGAAGASFDVLLAFSLDAEANRRVNQGISTLNQELERLQKEAAGVGDKYEESSEKVKQSSKDTIRQLQNEARIMRREAAAITDDLRAAQVATLKSVSGMVGEISQKALIAGSALTVGIFAEVQRYVSEAPNATRETRAWAAATAELGQARRRVDNVLLREALPLLQQAARVASQASRFVERHPEIINAALKTGVVLAGLGAIGLAVSRGIKIVADVRSIALWGQQLAAAKLQDLAADKQLAAAQMRAGLPASIPGGAGAGAAGAGLAGAALGIGSVVAVNAALTIGIKKKFDELDRVLVDRFGQSGSLITKFIETALVPVVPLLQPMRNLEKSLPGVKDLVKNLFGMGEQARKTAGAVADATGTLALAEQDMRVAEAWASWKEDDAKLVSEAAEERSRIIAEGEKTIADITKRFTNQRAEINERFNEARANIQRDYARDSQRAEEQYQQSRAEAIRSGHERLQELEREHEEKLAQIDREGADRLDELARSRDALGLVKEQRRIEEQRSEEIRAAGQARESVRRETEARLAELALSFAQEQAARRQQFEQELADNEAQRAEELQANAQLQQEELRQAREAQAAKLRELQEGLNAERLRRREVFIAQIRDLDASLLGERKLRNQYYSLMLNDANTWLSNYRRALGGSSLSGTTTGTSGGFPVRDSGGYADRGVYRLAWDRAREFVLSGQSTKAAEKIVGGSLTQENLIRALSAGAARNVNYVDNRRMERPIGKDDRAAFQRMAEDALLFAIGA